METNALSELDTRSPSPEPESAPRTASSREHGQAASTPRPVPVCRADVWGATVSDAVVWAGTQIADRAAAVLSVRYRHDHAQGASANTT